MGIRQMKRKEIIISIKNDGTINATIHGIKGTACHDVVEILKNGIGELVGEKRTAEYFEKQQLETVVKSELKNQL
jgi:hypothetical protein